MVPKAFKGLWSKPCHSSYRGFGALSLGGITGAAVALIGIVYALIVGTGEDIGYLYIMLAGGVLCAVFAGLCFKRYKKMPEA